MKSTQVTNSIRALRFARGEMTQSELADRVGVTRQTIIAIEQAKYSASRGMVAMVADYRVADRNVAPHRRQIGMPETPPRPAEESYCPW